MDTCPPWPGPLWWNGYHAWLRTKNFGFDSWRGHQAMAGGEHLASDQGVVGSTPTGRTKLRSRIAGEKLTLRERSESKDTKINNKPL